MKNNPQFNFGSEYDKPTNEIAGIIQAHEFMVHNAVAGTARALWPTVEAESRRLAHEREMKPFNAAPVIVQPSIRPTATEMLAQVATNQPEQPVAVSGVNILTNDPEDPAVTAEDLRSYINTLHEDERRAA
jgi:hypothetical protein